MTHKISEVDADRSLQDKAYDLLGEMLVDRDTERYLKELEEDVSHGNTAEMDTFFTQQDKINLQRIKTYSRKKHNRRLLRHTIPHLAQAAAVIIAVIVLTGGVALAVSKTVRVQVMRLLLHVEEEYTELSLIEDENASFDVPAEWQGSSFPSYIPEGLQVMQCISMEGANSEILYFGTEDRAVRLNFAENSQDAVTHVDTENAEVRPLMIGGDPGHISVKEDTIQIFWSDGIHYYVLCTEKIGEETTIQTAQSVRKIK